MSRKLGRWLVPLGAATMLSALSALSALALAGTASAAVVDPAPARIEPNQSFIGVVNGRSGQSVITVDCDKGAGLGHPAAGQTVEARQVFTTETGPLPSIGFTGSAAKAIGVSLGVSESPTPPIVLRFYGARPEIPTTLTVPCSGSGVVLFTPEPTSSTAVRAAVKVTFVRVVA